MSSSDAESLRAAPHEPSIRGSRVVVNASGDRGA